VDCENYFFEDFTPEEWWADGYYEEWELGDSELDDSEDET
jgi:hypothetical protein